MSQLNRYIKGIENQAEATKTELIKQIEEIEKVKNINENPSPDNISDKDYSDNSSNDSEDNDFEECAIHD
ncbi:9594_t:CDS:2 [Rhizophagus irregularis]|nr:9594_t:CDS:2 [Rhizophagus irregularis]